MSFNGFISYSHAADGRLAPAVQRGLHRLAKPWHQRRALWVFRDQTGLAVTPGLWSSIQDALDSSEWFVLLASPEAARSQWVNREIEHWVATRPAERILPVVTGGRWSWDPGQSDFTQDSSAVPPALRGVFAEEPLFLDLRWAREVEQLDLRHSRFRDAVAQLAAPMHGVSKDELEGEDVRQHRLARRLGSVAVSAVVVLGLVASLAGALAVNNGQRASAAAAEALHQQQVAAEQRGSAERSDQKARVQEANAQKQEKRARDAAAETRRQEENARRQAENARTQQGLADRAAVRAQRQERLAQQQREAAQRATGDARRQRQAAQEQERRAEKAAEEARKQQANAEQQQRTAVGRRLINQAKTTMDDDPKTALMLGLAAQKVQPDAEARSQLTGLITSTHYAGTLGVGINAVAYGPDGVLAVAYFDAAGDSELVSLWDLADEANPVRLASLSNDSTFFVATALVFSPDGRTLAVVGWEQTVTLWDVADRRHPARIAALPDLDIYSVAFSPDGRTVATSDLSSWTLWDVADRTRPRRLSAVRTLGVLTEAVFGADGNTVVTNDAGVIVWDVTDRANPVRLATLDDDDLGRPALAFSPNRAILATGREETVVLWDLTVRARPKRAATLTGLTDAVGKVAFSLDGRVLAADDARGMAQVWVVADPSHPSRLSSSIVTRGGLPRSMALSPDGRTLVADSRDHTAALWKTSVNGAPVPLAELTGQPADLLTVAFGPGGRSLATASRHGTVMFWDVTDRAYPVRRATVSIPSTEVAAMAFSPDLRTVAAFGVDGQATLTDVTDPARPMLLATLIRGGESTGDLGFSPDGRTLAISVGEGVMLWDLSDRVHPIRLATLPGTNEGPVAFSPDGRTLAATGWEGDDVSLWSITDRAHPRRLATLADKGGDMLMAFSPDGLTLVTGEFGTAMLWDVTDPTHPRRLATLTSDKDFETVGVSQSGRILATGSLNSTATLWDIADRAKPVSVGTLNGDNVQTDSVVFSPDERTLATSDLYEFKPTKVTLWDYTELTDLSAGPVKHACAIAGRGLTAGEWAQYIPELPYQSSCPG